MSTSNGELSDKIQKSFDFASDLVKQEITLASTILVLMIAVVKLALSDLGIFDFVLLGISWILLFLSIGTGCWSLMGLTYQLTTENPSIADPSVRGKASIQAVLFLVGLLFTIFFGFSVAWSEDAGENLVLTKENEIIKILPEELQQNKYAIDFVKIVTAWNNGSLDLPIKGNLGKHFDKRIQFSSANKPFGYESSKWVKKRNNQFAAFPDKVSPQLPFSTEAIETMLWAYSINLPVIENRYKVDDILKEDPLPIFLLFGQAQMIAIQRGTKNITSSQVVSAVFAWWTNDWPFCPPGFGKIQ